MTIQMKNLMTWAHCGTPGSAILTGDYARLEPLDMARHAEGLYGAVGEAHNRPMWAYMTMGPYEEGAGAFAESFEASRRASGWETMVICDAGTGQVLGMASYMRIREQFGSAEVGAVAFSDQLKRTRIATEAIYLMAAHLFDDLGYRRFEWKCDTRNDASLRAAKRFGFQYEGTFRQDMIVKGTNRDTAWFSMIDSEWPDLKAAFRGWLNPANFDESGQQKAPLQAFR